MDVVYTWATGATFAHICKMTDVFEGMVKFCITTFPSDTRYICTQDGIVLIKHNGVLFLIFGNKRLFCLCRSKIFSTNPLLFNKHSLLIINFLRNYFNGLQSCARVSAITDKMILVNHICVGIFTFCSILLVIT